MNEPLSQAVKIIPAVTLTAGAAAATNLTGQTIDMGGFDSVMFIFNFGAIVGGAAVSIRAQRGNVANLSDAQDILGSNQTIPDTADDTIFYMDIVRVGKQFVRPMVSRATQSATVVVTAILYDPSNKPTVQPAGVSGERFTDATEGAA